MRKLTALFALLGTLLWTASPTITYAQAAVQQVGPVTPGDPALWWKNGQVVDSSAFPTWFSGQFDANFGSTPGSVLCRSATQWTSPTPGAGGQFLEAQVGGCPIWATPSAFTNTVRTIASGTTDSAVAGDGTIFWASAASGAKSETLYACNSGALGKVLIVTDAQGNAATFAINITSTGSTINGASSFAINTNNGSAQFQCNGAGNWSAVSNFSSGGGGGGGTALTTVYPPAYTGAVTTNVQQALDGTLDINMFLTTAQVAAVQSGACTGDLTAAFQAAGIAVSVETNYTTGHGKVMLHHGCYNFAGTLDLTHTVYWAGESVGSTAGGSTILQFPASTKGIQIEKASGNCQTGSGGVNSGADGTTFDHVTIKGGGGSIDVTGAQSGIWACAPVLVLNSVVEGFPGDGIHIDTSVFGVADGWRVDNSFLQGIASGNSRYGLFTFGPDANAGTATGTLAITWGGSCFADASFLGNTYNGDLCEPGGAATNFVYAKTGGVTYQCLDPILFNASTHTTACKNTVPGTNVGEWYPTGLSAGNAYSNAINYIAGSDYSATNVNARSVFIGDYCEGGDPFVDIRSPSMMMGGLQGCGYALGAGSGGGSPVIASTSALNITGSFVSTLGGFAATDYTSNGTIYAINATLGGNAADGDVLGANNITQGADVYRFHYASLGTDLYEDVGASASTAARTFTMPGTPLQFGRGSGQPGYDAFLKGLMLSQGNDSGNSRWFGFCAGSTPTTLHADGDICLNTSAGNPGDVTFWIATVTGTPATWVPGGYLNATIVGGSPPTITGTCTTSTQTGGTTVGFFLATCAGQTVILALPTAPTGWVCDFHDETTLNDTLKQAAHTTNSVTASGTTAANDHIAFLCAAA